VAYHIYNTPGLILAATPSGEASRFVYVFTKDLGLVGAHAQNARSVKSKIRYAIDAPARAQVALVRGKNMWRLVNAVPDKRFVSVFGVGTEKFELCARIFSLIKKLMPGEEANPVLFSLIDSFLEFIETNSNDSDSLDFDLKAAEAILILRMLHILGYIPDHSLATEFAQGTEWNPEIVSAMIPQRKEAVKVINGSLRATGL
jgi:DNA repair protein RecO